MPKVEEKRQPTSKNSQLHIFFLVRALLNNPGKEGERQQGGGREGGRERRRHTERHREIETQILRQRRTETERYRDTGGRVSVIYFVPGRQRKGPHVKGMQATSRS